jgi:hypothetical protein
MQQKRTKRVKSKAENLAFIENLGRDLDRPDRPILDQLIGAKENFSLSCPKATKR